MSKSAIRILFRRHKSLNIKKKVTVLEEKTQNPSTPTLDLDLSKLMQKRTALSFSCVTSRRSVHLGHD